MLIGVVRPLRSRLRPGQRAVPATWWLASIGCAARAFARWSPADRIDRPGEPAGERGSGGVNGSVTKPGRHSQYRQELQGALKVSTLDKVSLDIQVVLGTTTMPVHQVLRLGRGAIIELESSEDDEVDILANNLPVAKGTVVVSGNRIAVEVRELLPRLADIR